ncbi:hypothetical protein L9F63_001315, partial [Diploptera punctata]
ICSGGATNASSSSDVATTDAAEVTAVDMEAVATESATALMEAADASRQSQSEKLCTRLNDCERMFGESSSDDAAEVTAVDMEAVATESATALMEAADASRQSQIDSCNTGSSDDSSDGSSDGRLNDCGRMIGESSSDGSYATESATAVMEAADASRQSQIDSCNRGRCSAMVVVMSGTGGSGDYRCSGNHSSCYGGSSHGKCNCCGGGCRCKPSKL